ncbi:uncharacterized protein LOC120081389 [Benincasa hispida]|uniref:uncharacterized protein LOC120081389 n=1 Tax=Benincasa hispida TaxID=102211 RepID=UPI0019013668|nr:uncharacterized protein LOC120081389 [Benincasa hispida]XP_038892148.1 uncharacterized protein LOC120081389 [Benincasa hispida]
MVRVASDGGTGRRLPQWMLGVRSDDQVQRSNDVEDNKKSLEEELDSQASLAKEANLVRCSRKSVLQQQKEILMDDSCILDCESNKRKGRKLKSSQIDEAKDADDLGAVRAKKSNRLRRKPLSSALEKRKRHRNLGSISNLDIQVQSPGGDDMELTVEDLMVIAKEYVEADMDSDDKHKISGERESSRINQRTSYTMNQAEGSFNTNNDSRQSSLDLKTSIPHGLTATSGGENVDTGVRTMGDPAKDMLDLFLGPLLKKSVEIEQSKFLATDVQFSCDLMSQNQRHNDNVGEVVSVTKKKSSLRDKVAIFLG